MNMHILDAIANGATYDTAHAASMLFDLRWDFMGGLTVTHTPTGETRYVEHWDNPQALADDAWALAELFE